MAKRFVTRHPVVLRVQVRTREGWREGVVFDASRGGVFLQFDNPLPEGSVAQLRLGLPDGTSLEAMAEVRRSIADAAMDPRGPGIGVRFLSMAPADQTRWNSFLPDPGGRIDAASQMPAYGDAGNTLEGMLPPPDAVAQIDAPQLTAPATNDADTTTPAAGQPAIRRAEISEVINTAVRQQIARARAARAGGAEKQRERGPKPPIALGADDRGDWLVLKYKPAVVPKLREFVDKCVKPGQAFIPTRQETEVGAPLELALRHPLTGAKMLVFGRVEKVREQSGAAISGVSVRFSPLNESELDALERFVGDRDATEGRRKRKDFARTGLQKRAESEHNSAMAHCQLGWFALLEDRDSRAANKAFLQAISVDARAVSAYRGLALSHALDGKREQSMVFARAAMKLEANRS